MVWLCWLPDVSGLEGVVMLAARCLRTGRCGYVGCLMSQDWKVRCGYVGCLMSQDWKVWLCWLSDVSGLEGVVMLAV